MSDGIDALTHLAWYAAATKERLEAVRSLGNYRTNPRAAETLGHIAQHGNTEEERIEAIKVLGGR
jgi:hypothetical protein